MVLSLPGGDPGSDTDRRPTSVAPSTRSGRLRIPVVLVLAFGGASLLSAELFSHFSAGGAPFLLGLVALFPLQAVALLLIWSQRHALSRGRSVAPDR